MVTEWMTMRWGGASRICGRLQKSIEICGQKYQIEDPSLASQI